MGKPAANVNNENYHAFVQLNLNNVPICGYVDSGNNFCNAMSVRCLKRVGLTLQDITPIKENVKTAKKGSTLTVLGRVSKKIPLTFKGIDLTFFTQPVVIKNLSMDFNLSGPFLKQNAIDQIHTRNVLSWRDKECPLVERPHQSISTLTDADLYTNSTNISPVYLSNPVTLPPNALCRATVNVARVQDFKMGVDSGIVSLGPVTKSRYDFDGINGFANVDQRGRSNVVLLNPNEWEIPLPKGLCLGSFEAAEDVIDEVLEAKIANHTRTKTNHTPETDHPEEQEPANWSHKKKRRWLTEKFELNRNPVLKKSSDREATLNLLERYFDLFSHGDQYGETKLIQHEIKLMPGATPVKLKNRPLNPTMMEDLLAQLRKWRKQRVIEPSVSPWSFQLLPVRKKNGTWRWCVDYRRLNDLTVKDSHPLPVIDDVLARLNGNKYFTALDQTGAYHVVPIKPEDREKTAFQTPEGLFQFCRMAFGLCNAPATFSRLVQQVLEDIPHEVALAYLDDTLVLGKSIEQHLTNLEKVLERFQAAGLSLQPEKCKLFRRKWTSWDIT